VCERQLDHCSSALGSRETEEDTQERHNPAALNHGDKFIDLIDVKGSRWVVVLS
jgi:hypothetical protein